MMLKVKLMFFAIAAGILTFLATFARIKTLKHQRNKAVRQKNILTARVEVAKVQKEIEVKQKEELVKKLEEAKEKVDAKKPLDNLSNPNDF